MMHNKIRRYINRAFASTEDSKASQDLQEEIIANLIDKFDDLLENGKKEEDAYQIVIASVGDLDHLMVDLPKEKVSSENNDQQKKNALLMAIGIGLIILSPVALFGFGDQGDGVIGLMLMFVLVAIGAGLLVYSHESKRSQDTSSKPLLDTLQQRKAHQAISGAYWLLVVFIYLSISFSTDAWHITWLIFLIASALAGMMKGMVLLRGDDHE